MDFREHKDAAKASTRKLLALFFFLLLVVAVLVPALLLGMMVWADTSSMGITVEDYLYSNGEDLMNWGAILAMGTAGWVLVATGFRMIRSSDGHKVARSMGGSVLNEESLAAYEAMIRKRKDSGEYSEASFADSEMLAMKYRQTLNVFEEMVLASGLPRPTLYLLTEEQGINAFAAGTGDKMAVAITAGAIHNLDREQIAAVLAHELGHVAHQDVRLNMRLAAMIFGLASLTLLARFVWYRGMHASDNRARVAAIVIAVTLWVLGLVSAFAGRLLQAAVSRQREFLADASAVQFTRNPIAMREALEVIRTGKPTHLQDPHAREYGHAFLLPAFKSAGWLETHPPVEERINRLNRSAR